jgi:TetR/AcrR family transcriptional regulator
VSEKPKDSPARRRILKRVRKLFAARGFDGVSVAELARAAGVNRAMLYYYFADKRDIYRECIISVLELIPALWEREEMRTGPPAERLDRYVTALGGALERNRDAMPIIIREISSGGAETELIFRRYLIPNAMFVGNILDEGMRSGDFSAAAVPFATIAVLGGLIMPNFGASLAKPFITEAAGPQIAGPEYLEFYRAYVKRALGARIPKGGKKRGTNK